MQQECQECNQNKPPELAFFNELVTDKHNQCGGYSLAKTCNGVKTIKQDGNPLVDDNGNIGYDAVLVYPLGGGKISDKETVLIAVIFNEKIKVEDITKLPDCSSKNISSFSIIISTYY